MGVGVAGRAGPRSCDEGGSASVTGAAGRHELAGAGGRYGPPGRAPGSPRGSGGEKRPRWVDGRSPELGGREGRAWGPRGCGTWSDAGGVRAAAGGRCPRARFQPTLLCGAVSNSSVNVRTSVCESTRFIPMSPWGDPRSFICILF